jgi:hypothetical protein
MNEGFSRLEYFLTDHWTNNVRLMIATNIAVFGTVIASLAFLSNYLKKARLYLAKSANLNTESYLFEHFFS